VVVQVPDSQPLRRRDIAKIVFFVGEGVGLYLVFTHPRTDQNIEAVPVVFETFEQGGVDMRRIERNPGTRNVYAPRVWVRTQAVRYGLRFVSVYLFAVVGKDSVRKGPGIVQEIFYVRRRVYQVIVARNKVPRHVC
jgi:hypothetical protein